MIFDSTAMGHVPDYAVALNGEAFHHGSAVRQKERIQARYEN